MELMQIRFTEWRDAPKDKRSAGVIASERVRLARLREIEVAARVRDAEREMRGEGWVSERERLEANKSELLTCSEDLAAARAAEASVGEAERQAALAHEMVGRLGYLVLNAERSVAQKVVLEDGADLPAGAVYGYEIVNERPATPRWATAQGSGS